MTFLELVNKLAELASRPHHPDCHQGMDSRLQCSCGAAFHAIKVQGCKANLEKLWNDLEKGIAKPALHVVESKGEKSSPGPTTTLVEQPAPNATGHALRGLAVVPNIDNPFPADESEEVKPAPPPVKKKAITAITAQPASP